MATKTYVRAGRIQSPMTVVEQAIYNQAADVGIGETFQADLTAPTETWLIGHGVIAHAPNVAVSLPVDGLADGDMPTADGAGGYDWEQ